MSGKRLFQNIILVLLLAPPCHADDLYVIDAHALGLAAIDSCSVVVWDVDTVFHNRNHDDAIVTVVGVSNGGLRSDVPRAIVIPAGRAESIRQQVGILWKPVSGDNLWIYRLSVPDGVVVETEMFPSRTNIACPLPVFVKQEFGKVNLPIFKSLVPPAQQQLITGLTLGDLQSRVNIAVYNAGLVSATASIELHRACDGLLITTKSVTLDPDSVKQITGFAPIATPADCTRAFSFPNGLNGMAYALITVDQPSVTFGSIVANTQLPVAAVSVVSGH